MNLIKQETVAQLYKVEFHYSKINLNYVIFVKSLLGTEVSRLVFNKLDDAEIAFANLTKAD